MAPIRIPLKKKYRVAKQGKKTTYRARTGPRCCNNNCPSKPDGVNFRKETWGHKVVH